MANSSLKTIVNARSTSFKMTGNRTISASFSSSNLGNDYFWLYVAGGAYQTYRICVYYNEDESPGDHGGVYEKNQNDVGWPHSSPYVPGAVIQMQVVAPATRNYSVNVKLNCGFSFNDSSSSPANSFYRVRMDIDGRSIYDGGWKDGYGWPFNQNMIAVLQVPSSLRWCDFGTYNVYLTKGIHTVLMRFGACHQYNKHAAIAINNMRVSLS